MRKIIFICLYLSTTLGFCNKTQSSFKNAPCFIYCGEYGTRLGDRLLLYSMAKWIAYKNKLPLRVEPFPYYEELMGSLIDLPLEKIPPNYNKNYVHLESKLTKKNGSVYLIHAYPYGSDIPTMKNDPYFLRLLRTAISPKAPLDLIIPPKHLISVAVHIRNGGGFDNPLISVQIFDSKETHHPVYSTEYQDKSNPLKFPPEQFYIDQIKKISEIFSNQPLYLFIFTDDANPSILCERIKKHVDLDNIIFDCRKSACRHDMNVLEDLFSMLNFDCLIRPSDSHFSSIVYLLGDHQVVIYPDSYHWETDSENREYLIMDQIQIKKK